VTPVTASVLEPLSAVLVQAAAEVRGMPTVSATDVFGALPAPLVAGLTAPDAAPLNAETAWGVLEAMGLAGGAEAAAGAGAGAGADAGAGSSGLPDRMAALLAMIEALPAPLTETLLTELLARLVEPRS
jgi:sphinganine-1-phosphate aldolase